MELSNYCEHNSLDVIAISEILPKFSLFQPEETNYSLDGFDIFTSDLTSGRGCALFVKQDLAATKITYTSNFSESVWCQINLKNNDKMIVGCIYRSPNSTIENNKELFQLLNSVNNKHFSHILIVGDFNCKEIDWRLQSTSVNENHVASQLLECVRDCFMYQHVAEPTRFRIGEISSILDLIFTNEENMISELKYMAGLGKSDHLQLTFNFNCYIEVKRHFFKKHNFFKGKYTELANDLSTIDWDGVFNGLDLSDSWDILTDKITGLIEKYIPESRVSSRQCKKNPIVNNDCIEAIKRKHTKWKKYQYCKTEQNYELYKNARNNVKTEMRKSKYSYEKDLASKIKTDPKLFWSYVRSKMKTKSSLSQLKSPCGTLTNDNTEKAGLLNKFFASVFETEGTEALPDFPDREFADIITTVEITENTIMKAISKLKPSKSQGPDNIHPKLIKECSHQLLTPLKTIFVKSLEESKIPEVWRKANVTAIHKSGDKTNPENYRPISLTSVPCKLMERLVRDTIMDHMEQNNLFSPYQHGFIPGKSCITQLLEILEEITDALDQGYDIDIIYVDYTKAFDKIQHNRLLKKLWGYGIRGKIHAWVKEFLSNRTQRVAVNGSYSSYENVTSGVPQGSVLGPILFVIYINDLPDVIKVMMRMYADDSKFLRRIKTTEHENQVQLSVNNSVTWANEWHMFYHFKKCHHLHIGNNVESTEYTMETPNGNATIDKVESEKDLGVIFDSKLNFTEHISTKVSKANQIVGLIFRTFTFIDREMFLNLFKSLIRPILEYATTIWSPMYKKDAIQIENVQRRATRLVKGLKEMSYPERLKILGLPTLEYRRDRADMVQVYKILHGLDKADKDSLFKMATYQQTRGHPLKLFKKRYRLRVRGHFFCNRVVDGWNELPPDVVNAPSLNSFKSRLNKCWKGHPYKFDPWCYTPGEKIQRRINQNASTEVFGPGRTSTT